METTNNIDLLQTFDTNQTLSSELETFFGNQLNKSYSKYESRFKELQEKILNISRQNDKQEYFKWLDFNYLKKINEQSIALASELKAAKSIKNILVVGMGGSGINALVLKDALYNFKASQDSSKPNLLIQNNLDPSSLMSKLNSIQDELDESIFIIISKSGGTDEVKRNLNTILNFADSKAALKETLANLVFITEPAQAEKKNFLHELSYEVAEKYSVKIPFLENHPEIGGRFSMFSPVGMFVAELVSLNSEKLLAGAEKCLSDFCQVGKLETNQIAKLAMLDIMLTEAGIVNRYSMVYSDALEGLNKFRAQLKGESLNKDGLESTVHIPGIGTVNHHSDLELLFKQNNKLILEQIFFAEPYADTQINSLEFQVFKAYEAESNHQSLVKNHIEPLRNYLISQKKPVLTSVIAKQDEYHLAYFMMQDMLITIVQAGLQDCVHQNEKLDLAIRQWEVEKYKASIRK
jgi:glucose-6-phosphate isomerase